LKKKKDIDLMKYSIV